MSGQQRKNIENVFWGNKNGLPLQLSHKALRALRNVEFISSDIVRA